MTPEEFKAKYLGRIGFRLSIKEEPRTHDCIFLQQTSQGKSCSIYPVRPAQCRSWPFWPTNLAGPDSWNLVAQKCPGINRGQSFTPEQIQTKKNTKLWWLKENKIDTLSCHCEERSDEAISSPLIQHVQDIYTWLDDQLEIKSPVCALCGKCCDFEAYDHRLFVTTPEIIYFAQKLTTSNVIASEAESCPEKSERFPGLGPRNFFEISEGFRTESPKGAKQSQPLENKRLPRRSDSSGLLAMTNGRCPYRAVAPDGETSPKGGAEDKCTVYPYRFAGCRIFSCKGNPDFQSDLTEVTIKKFKSLCEEFDVPYRYVDLPTALNDFLPTHT